LADNRYQIKPEIKIIGNKVTDNSAGVQTGLQLININKNKAIKTPKVVNIFMPLSPKNFLSTALRY
jgi:hypothetical protein